MIERTERGDNIGNQINSDSDAYGATDEFNIADLWFAIRSFKSRLIEKNGNMEDVEYLDSLMKSIALKYNFQKW
jgi:hypothetical protein